MVEDRDSEKRNDFLGDLLVLFIRLVLAAPTVEDAIVESQRLFLRISNHKRRTVISHPDIDRRNLADGDVVKCGSGVRRPHDCISSSWFGVDRQTYSLLASPQFNHP